MRQQLDPIYAELVSVEARLNDKLAEAAEASADQHAQHTTAAAVATTHLATLDVALAQVTTTQTGFQHSLVEVKQSIPDVTAEITQFLGNKLDPIALIPPFKEQLAQLETRVVELEQRPIPPDPADAIETPDTPEAAPGVAPIVAQVIKESVQKEVARCDTSKQDAFEAELTEIKHKLRWLPFNTKELAEMSPVEARLYVLETRLRAEETRRIRDTKCLAQTIETIRTFEQFPAKSNVRASDVTFSSEAPMLKPLSVDLLSEHPRCVLDVNVPSTGKSSTLKATRRASLSIPSSRHSPKIVLPFSFSRQNKPRRLSKEN